ncbi:Transposase IS200 like protein [Clostridium tertium]|uniref:Transposase IS200 like protein n=1 Tax=Clostridium tertium TaxID=1559 RepID=A0A6N3AQQ8_9CLOT
MNDIHSLSYTKWCCKYHMLFAPKYRRNAFYGARRLEIGAILRNLCEWKDINILETEVCIDHVHMLIEIPPKMSVSGFMGFLKGKSNQMIYEKWGNARFKYRNRSFW